GGQHSLLGDVPLRALPTLPRQATIHDILFYDDPVAAKLRSTVEAWVHLQPSNEHKELRSRLMDPGQCTATFMELAVGATLRKLVADVKPKPQGLPCRGQ